MLALTAMLDQDGEREHMIARALYHRPRILFLDESTAHLDLEIERAIHDSLQALRITLVLVAHRPDTLRVARRVLDVRSKEVKLLACA